VYCVAYNRVRQLLAGQPVKDCVYDASGYFGTCVCPDSKYKCMGRGYCEVSYSGTQTYEECSKQCS
jgi:hypothetical protein